MKIRSTLLSLTFASILTSSVALKDDDDHHRHGMGAFCFEKGIQCKGGMIFGKGGHVGCSGALKSEFSAKCDKDEMAQHLANHVKEQFKDVALDDQTFMPSDTAFEEMGIYDDAAFVDGLPDGHEHTVEFGGFVAAGFGCKVTFKKDGGVFKKVADCGLKLHKGHGMKPSDEELMELDFRRGE
jgi:hypothetical protein